MKGEDEDVLAQEFVRDFITFTGTLLAMEIVLVIASGVGLYVPGWIIIPTYSDAEGRPGKVYGHLWPPGAFPRPNIFRGLNQLYAAGLVGWSIAKYAAWAAPGNDEPRAFCRCNSCVCLLALCLGIVSSNGPLTYSFVFLLPAYVYYGRPAARPFGGGNDAEKSPTYYAFGGRAFLQMGYTFLMVCVLALVFGSKDNSFLLWVEPTGALASASFAVRLKLAVAAAGWVVGIHRALQSETTQSYCKVNVFPMAMCASGAFVMGNARGALAFAGGTLISVFLGGGFRPAEYEEDNERKLRSCRDG